MPKRPTITIEVETDGTGPGTTLKMDGIPMPCIYEFHLSILSNGRLKIQGVRGFQDSARREPFSYYGPGDVEKIASARDGSAPGTKPGEFIGAKANQEA
jgi:hypothetical protein